MAEVAIDITGEEVPVLDGSAASFVYLLQSAGSVLQDAPKRFLRVLEPVEADVAVGAVVDAGDPVGRLAGAPPHCPRACVHWGVREPDGWRVGDAAFDRYLDPLAVLARGGRAAPPVLLPLG